MHHTQLPEMFSQKVLETVSSSLITQHLLVVVVPQAVSQRHIGSVARCRIF